jgi:hypothetical protein
MRKRAVKTAPTGLKECRRHVNRRARCCAREAHFELAARGAAFEMVADALVLAPLQFSVPPGDEEGAGVYTMHGSYREGC